MKKNKRHLNSLFCKTLFIPFILCIPKTQSESASCILLRAALKLALRRHTRSCPAPTTILRTSSSVSRRKAASLQLYRRHASSTPSSPPFWSDVRVLTTWAECRRQVSTADAARRSSGSLVRIASRRAISSACRSGE